MDNKITSERLFGYLAQIGARSLKLTNRQEMKLREWILVYSGNDLGITNSSPIEIKELRKYIDEWQNAELKDGNYKHYYEGSNTTLW